MHEQLFSMGQEALLLMVLISLPPLAASLLVGVLSSLFQAATQLQEQTLSVVPRLAAAAVSLILFGPWIAQRLVSFAARLMFLLPELST